MKPSEVVVDFIHNSHQHFHGGIFWINCTSEEFISDSIHYIEKVSSDGAWWGQGSIADVIIIIRKWMSVWKNWMLRKLGPPSLCLMG